MIFNGFRVNKVIGGKQCTLIWKATNLNSSKTMTTKERKTGNDESDDTFQQRVRTYHGPISPEDFEKELRYTPLFAMALFTGVLSIYVMTLHPSVSGGDNGELLGCACELGSSFESWH
jgi:hypothetical protein